MVFQEVLQRRQEPWRWRVQWLAIRSWQWPLVRIIKADPLTTTWGVAEELNANHSKIVWHLKQVRKLKKLDKWVPHKLTTNQKKKKNHCFKVSFLLILYNNEPVLKWIVMCDKKCILCDNQQLPAQWLHWEAPKPFPQLNLHPQKCHGHSLLVCCWSDLL